MNDKHTYIIEPLATLNGLKDGNVLSCAKVEWWLLKYSIIYKKTHDFVYRQHLLTNEDGSFQLPSCIEQTDKEIFLDLYKDLDTISELHRNEKYFEQEIIIYHKIKYAKNDLKSWVEKNEEIGANKYGCFFAEYLDYDEDEKEEHLKVFIHSLKEFEYIYIDQQDFKFTINFLRIFNDLYWDQKILPESIERRNLEIDKLPFDDTYWDRMSEDFDVNNLL